VPTSATDGLKDNQVDLQAEQSLKIDEAPDLEQRRPSNGGKEQVVGEGCLREDAIMGVSGLPS